MGDGNKLLFSIVYYGQLLSSFGNSMADTLSAIPLLSQVGHVELLRP